MPRPATALSSDSSIPVVLEWHDCPFREVSVWASSVAFSHKSAVWWWRRFFLSLVSGPSKCGSTLLVTFLILNCHPYQNLIKKVLLKKPIININLPNFNPFKPPAFQPQPTPPRHLSTVQLRSNRLNSTQIGGKMERSENGEGGGRSDGMMSFLTCFFA